MSTLENVTVTREANVYFDGKVTSRTVELADGSKITLGIMMPGEYEFNTDAKEIMEVLAGEVDILLPGADDWQSVKAGDSFEVPASSSFQLKVHSLMDYSCAYLD